MSELKLISPLLDHMEIEKCIQSGGGVSVYLLRRAATDQLYILKHISVPESQTQVDALLFTGAAASEEEAQAYYEQVVDDYREELSALELLHGSTNFATFQGYQICQKEDGVGFEIYLLSDKWPTLVEYLSENVMTHLRALNLGLDLCTALCDLRAHGLIHRDVKPENIYLNGLNSFMLGDLGVALIDNLKYCSMPERMVTEYTAPEMTDILSTFNTTIDIYSIGMILYRILNGNHGPFEDEKTSAKAANKRRIGGEPLPAPLYSDYELTEIILKACAFEPTDRYQTPEEMMQELVLYMKRNSVSDSLIVPPIISDPDILVSPESMDEEIEPVRFADVSQMDEKFVANFSPDTQSLNAIIEEVRKSEPPAEAKSPPQPPQPDPLPEPTPEPPEPDAQPSELEPEVPSEPQEPPEPSDAPKPPAFAAPNSVQPLEEDDAVPPEPSPTPPPKRKRPKLWIPITIAAVLVCVIALSVYFLAFGGPALHLSGIQIVDKGTDYLTVSVDTGGKNAALTLECFDTYGNIQTQTYQASEDVTFSGLTSGVQYTIRAVSNSQKRLSGNTSVMAATVSTTEIVSFTATSARAGQVELNLIVSGPDPGEWTVRYYADGVAPQEVSFSGHTVSIFNLEANANYTFELLEPEGIALSGNSKLTFSSAPEVTISNLTAASLSESSVVVTWECGENDPGAWSISCTGTDGFAKTLSVKERKAEFTGLTAGQTYTVTVTSAGAAAPASITVTPNAATVSSVKAAAADNGSVNVTWESNSAAGAWQIVYTVKGTSISSKQKATGKAATLSGLIPGKTYQIEVQSETGEKLSGSASTEVTLSAAEPFGAYGASRFFMGMFLRPAKDNWSKKDLAAGTTSFSKDQKIAFAVESLTGRNPSSDTVQIVYVVEDSKGTPITTGASSAKWDDMWRDNLFLGEIAQTPQTAGTYTLRLYFNQESVAKKEFTVK